MKYCEVFHSLKRLKCEQDEKNKSPPLGVYKDVHDQGGLDVL